MLMYSLFCIFFFFNDTATTEIYTLSLHDALPICVYALNVALGGNRLLGCRTTTIRSEEHTSELQSRRDLVCRLLLEKKNTCDHEVVTFSRGPSVVKNFKLLTLP